ncbi:MAG: type II toxin-antitoxin system RelE/ParE family toxin [Eubacteriaceae bacterium]|nr:type II toxin-antitoxin system RelE/ParE family toxin [Eubacteriaceae bacterium]
MAELRVLPPARRFIKKIKDKELKKLYQQAIDEILADPSVGEDKHGDLAGLKGYDIYYRKINYELAYTVEYIENEAGDTEVVVVILAGTRENFYEALKRYWK